MKTKTLVVIGSLLSVFNAMADNCSTLIQYGLRDEIQSVANSNNYSESVNGLCQDYSTFKKDKASGNLKATYGSFGGSAGFSSEKYESISEALCSSSTNISSLKSESVLTNRILRPEALSALQQCESLNAFGLRVTSDIPDAAETVTISFYLQPIPGMPPQEIVVGKPFVDDELVSCSEPFPSLVAGKLPALTNVTYSCKRKISEKPFNVHGRMLYAKEATITIPTGTAAIVRRLPAVYAESPPSSNVDLKIESLFDSAFPVGSVLSSMFNPDEHIKSNPRFGKYWALADGSNADRGSKYFQIKTDGSLNNVKLPDLRGLFLRGLNIGRTDGKQDPDGSQRVTGDFQFDSLQKHKHAITRGSMGGDRAWRGGWFWASADGDSGQQKGITDDNTYLPDGNGGDVRVATETRPKNSAVYYYIKIN